MAIKTTLEVNSSQFDKAIDKSVAQANKKLGGLGQSQAGGGLLGTVAKGSKMAGGEVGSIGEKITSLTGMSTGAAAGAAAFAVAKLGVEIYKAYRKSVLDAAEAEREKSRATLEELDALKKSNAERATMAQKLTDLQGVEKLSEVQKIEAKKAIDKLGESYKQYGIVLDEVNGKLINADKAQAALLEADKAREIAKTQAAMKQLEADRKAQDEVIAGAGVNIFGVQVGGEEEAKAAAKAIQDIGKQAGVLRSRLAELNRLNPGKDALDTANAQNLDKVQKVYDGIEAQNKALRDQLGLSKQEIEMEKAFEQLRNSGSSVDEASQAKIVAAMREQQGLKSEKFYKDQTEALDEQLKIEQMKAQGLDREARKQMLINELKKQGLKYDEDSLESILNKQDDLARLKELQEKINAPAKLTLNYADTQSNDLTRRGGARSLAVVSNADRINQQIANFSKAQVDILRELKEEVKRMVTY